MKLNTEQTVIGECLSYIFELPLKSACYSKLEFILKQNFGLYVLASGCERTTTYLNRSNLKALNEHFKLKAVKISHGYVRSIKILAKRCVAKIDVKSVS